VTGNEVSARWGFEYSRGVFGRGNSKPVTTFPVSGIFADAAVGQAEKW